MSDNETVYRMGGESVPASKLPGWHHARELPWGTEFRGPAPVTIRRMGRSVLNNISVHLANEHGIRADGIPGEQRHLRHLLAHMYAEFSQGQEHYHRKHGSGREDYDRIR